MKRKEVIAAIEKLKGGFEYPNRIEDIERILEAFRESQFLAWHRSWIRKGILLGMFGPLFIFILTPRVIGQQPISSQSPWLVYLLLGSMIIFAWLYMKLRPECGGDNLGVHRKCVKCKYDLSGHDSLLGDELWVGPAACPECGQDYPAVGR